MRSIKKFKIFEGDDVKTKYGERLKSLQVKIDRLEKENEELKKTLDKEIQKNK